EYLPKSIIINDDRITELIPQLTRVSKFLGIPFECNNIVLDINQINRTASIEKNYIGGIENIIT
ncbi:MAG: hypothetical protein GY828_00630, partial [Candidatus Gracilibacteria bacterium]|nr:hypothetical protein [Candidatus Gracilibacteria bacterium]